MDTGTRNSYRVTFSFGSNIPMVPAFGLGGDKMRTGQILWQHLALGDWIMLSLTVCTLLLVFGLLTLADVAISAYRQKRASERILRYHQENFLRSKGAMQNEHGKRRAQLKD